MFSYCKCDNSVANFGEQDRVIALESRKLGVEY